LGSFHPVSKNGKMPTMCGRFTLNIPLEALIERFCISEFPSFALQARFNIAPTLEIPVVRQYADYADHLDLLRWGFIPSWQKEPHSGSPLINARSESIAEKPAFRQAIKYRRCLVPASGFYEWLREGDKKVPQYIRLKDGSPMVFAAVWEASEGPDGKPVDTCAILTTAANNLVAPLHNRMPVILHPAEFSSWLDRDQRDPEKLQRLYEPFPADMLEKHAVSQLVNSTKHEGPDLIIPVREP
jgi:putative SOS response-associated peptidase YedK